MLKNFCKQFCRVTLLQSCTKARAVTWSVTSRRNSWSPVSLSLRALMVIHGPVSVHVKTLRLSVLVMGTLLVSTCTDLRWRWYILWGSHLHMTVYQVFSGGWLQGVQLWMLIVSLFTNLDTGNRADDRKWRAGDPVPWWPGGWLPSRLSQSRGSRGHPHSYCTVWACIQPTQT